MALSTGSSMTYGRRSAVMTRNRALLAIVGVITGAALFFRAQKPSGTNSLTTQEDRRRMRKTETLSEDPQKLGQAVPVSEASSPRRRG
ncbi:hypothetical protein VTN31DRAFT_423 [Thermomyces dupontii]|uniref:uncharacterized protein n=1 Tax=Talaromyces thermophilus TaxID=28565 RepID=UPI0037444DF7